MSQPVDPSQSTKRREPRPGSLRERRPAPAPKKKNTALWVGLAFLAVAAVVGIKLAVDSATAVKTSLRVLDASGKPLGKGKLEFFPYDDTGAARVHPVKLGELEFENGAKVVAERKLVDGYALVRASAPGLGRASFLAYVGEHRENEVKLLPAAAIRGKVQDPSGGTVAGARVEAVGSGPTGLVLAEATSAADGAFALEGISPSMHHVAIRVFKEGHALAKELEYSFDSPADLVCNLVATKLITGRVSVPSGVPKKGLVVQAYAVPGIATETDENGGFVLDHVAPNLEPKLIVVNLPAGHTQWSVTAHPGEEVEIKVTRGCQISGTVVDGRSGQIPHMAIVRHEHGPRGGESFRLDEFGRFFLVHVPEGSVTIEAFSGIRREATSPYAALQLEFAGGESKRDVAITLK